MTFEEALKLLKEGKKVNRRDWLDYIYLGSNTDKTIYPKDQLLLSSYDKSPYYPTLGDMEADDWMEVILEADKNKTGSEFVINCEKIILANNGFEIEIKPKDLGSCKSIIVNGIKFNRED